MCKSFWQSIGAALAGAFWFAWRWLRRRPPGGESPLEKIVDLAEDGAARKHPPHKHAAAKHTPPKKKH